MLCQVCPFNMLDGVSLPSQGASRGIWDFQNTSVVATIDSIVGELLVSIRGGVKGSEDFWLITGVYRPYDSRHS